MHPKHNWYEKEKGELVTNDVIYERKFLLKTVHKKIAHVEKSQKKLNCCFVYIEPIPPCFVQKTIKEKCGSS